jgi:hypothetical protein
MAEPRTGQPVRGLIFASRLSQAAKAGVLVDDKSAPLLNISTLFQLTDRVR